MPVAAISKTDALTFDAEPSWPEPSKRHATCAWCGRDWRSIVELIDHVEATHLDYIDMASPPSATRMAVIS